MNIQRNFISADRYTFDFSLTTQKGWAQIDTSQDASYYGTWCNPFKMKIFSYVEGDTCMIECESQQEFIDEIIKIDQWNEQNAHWMFGIDPGFNEELKNKFIEYGLDKYIRSLKKRLS